MPRQRVVVKENAFATIKMEHVYEMTSFNTEALFISKELKHWTSCSEFLTINCLWFLPYMGFTMKILCIKLYCILTNVINVRYNVLHTYITGSRLNRTVGLITCDILYRWR